MVLASVLLMAKFSAKPNAPCPYIIPKLTLFALYRISFVTSSSFTPYTLAAVAV